MWDPDAGLVVPRSQEVVNFAVESAKEKGSLKTFTNTPAVGFETEDGKIVGVKTDKGTIKTEKSCNCFRYLGAFNGRYGRCWCSFDAC